MQAKLPIIMSHDQTARMEVRVASSGSVFRYIHRDFDVYPGGHRCLTSHFELTRSPRYMLMTGQSAVVLKPCHALHHRFVVVIR
jgi:hypothetical protein